jgi:phenylalanyl-tRNA synthetase beta chain
MLISKKWLNEFVKTPKGLSDEDIAEAVTLSTVEVESVVDQAGSFNNMIVGVIKSVGEHSNADKLKVCKVDVGGRVTQIVCGGSNVREEMKVVVALPGARVRWHGEGDHVELKKTKIRGEESEGMICAGNEIGFTHTDEGEHEILDLGAIEASAGDPLSNTMGLDDVIFDIEHKSLTNRPDLMGHYGMAREIAALTRSVLKEYKPTKITAGKGISLSVDVQDQELCPRYMAVALKGIVVGPSPEWLRNRLSACGVRSINNVVDVTNFVMLELGEPMHAFDADVLGGDKVKIGVRKAKKKEKITCLDEETYELDQEMLLITDGSKPMAIAGVMGGEDSGVSDTTTRIVFEAANFFATSVRKTSTKLALRSESSARFEKSLDPNLCELALARAVELMKELCPTAKVCSAIVDEKKKNVAPKPLSFPSDLVNARLGSSISIDVMKDILTRLGFGVSLKKDIFTVTIPSWRATKDISIKEDVIEEIARIYGYENIPSTLPTFMIDPPVVDPVAVLARKARKVLSYGTGASEVYQYAFVSPETLEALGESLEDHLKLANPLASDRPYLVSSLIPNLLETAEHNQRSFETVKIYQCERVFRKDEVGEEMGEGKNKLPGQPRMLAGVYTKKGDENPFWKAKEMMGSVMSVLGFSVELRPLETPKPWQHPGRQAQVIVSGEVVGYVSEIDPEKSGVLGLDNRVAVFEINLDHLANQDEPKVVYDAVSVHPAVKRDLAFVAADRTEFASIEAAVRRASQLLESIELFDVYRGKGVEEGHKSMAIHLSFRADEKTLESSEVDVVMNKIRGVLEKDFGATMRS